MRLRLPPGYVLPAHTHAGDERVTVLEGSVTVEVEGRPAKSLDAASYYVTPARLQHSIRAGSSGATLQVTGLGPWTLEFAEKNQP